MKTSEKEIGKELAYISFFDYFKVMANIQTGHRFIKRIRANKPLEEEDYEEMDKMMRLLPTFVERLHKQSLEIANKLNNDNQ